jgi:ATP-dependent helicase Lhr and Lhr-like helicase
VNGSFFVPHDLQAPVRGTPIGRFVSSFSGEQYALPEAVGLLREMRRRPLNEQWISLSGADPLNLVGILAPGPKLPALTDNRLIYRDGVPVATRSAGIVDFLTTLDSATLGSWKATSAVCRAGIAFPSRLVSVFSTKYGMPDVPKS